ncbi:MAG: ligase-associated DNA damage response endonuclease PdeM [Alphaproteobacteria bacterium]|nr:ligase-associated DNA damage response endonuclease PdeM [Alphaproteobacteria bacterium]
MENEAPMDSVDPTPAAAFEVNGERLVALTAGAAYWPAERALLVADLHFEKGTAYARRGVLLPPYDTRTTLRRLSVLIERHRPRTVYSLGDAFHDIDAEARMDPEDAGLLQLLLRRTHWVWIAGNHDPLPPGVAGDICLEARVGRLRLVHEPTGATADAEVAGEVAGHLHPCARVLAEGRSIRRRCFATDGRRLILPAFGAYAGGLNVLDEAYDGMFDGLTAWVLGGRGVYPFSGRKLLSDRRSAPTAADPRRAAGV